jgi:hypothetical protein
MGKKLLYLFLLTILGFQSLMAQTENATRTGQNADAQPATIQYLYEEAFEEIKGMLEGKQKASFKKAVFLTENAFLEGQVPYPAFEQIIQETTKLCQYIESIDSLIYTHKDRDEVRKNAAIFRYMTQALVLEDSLLTLPYRYDFEDFMGKDDWTKTFVSKLLVTHQGNCHSLPYLYKILADEMGAKAWLSLAPNHIYIKNQSQKISWYNTELTSATFPIDAWLMASGYITYESVVNRVYMDTLGVKQSLALCLVDLAQGYQRKQVNYNPDFALKCVDLALQYYPQYVNALLLKADILRQRSINQAHQDPQTTQELIKICDKIYDLGYREMPESMYMEWLSGDKYKAPDSVRTQNTQKGNPFGYKKEVLTLSNGRYDEFQEKERLVKIGWVMYDTERKVISEYLSPNPEKVQIAPELVSRFLSVDPLGKKFPFLSPYQFAGNKPIWKIDLDGLENANSDANNENTPHDLASMYISGSPSFVLGDNMTLNNFTRFGLFAYVTELQAGNFADVVGTEHKIWGEVVITNKIPSITWRVNVHGSFLGGEINAELRLQGIDPLKLSREEQELVYVFDFELGKDYSHLFQVEALQKSIQLANVGALSLTFQRALLFLGAIDGISAGTSYGDLSVNTNALVENQVGKILNAEGDDAEDDKSLTADEIIGKFKKGSVRNEFPAEHINSTLAEIEKATKQKGEAGAIAKKAKKLLKDKRFDKGDNRK